MDNIQSKWIKLLNEQNFSGWEVKSDEDEVLIIVPDDQDLVLVHKNIPDILLTLKPAIDSNERVVFVVGNSQTSFGFIVNPNNKDLHAKI